MEISENTKRILLYGGGGASILLLFVYFRNRQSQAGPVGYPGTGISSGGGASNDTLAAAQINSATQIALAGQAQETQRAVIAAGSQAEQTRSQTALGVANIQASGVKTAAAIGAAGQVLSGPAGSAGGELIKGILDIGKRIADGITDAIRGINSPTIGGYAGVGPTLKPGEVYGPQIPPEYNYGNYPGSGFIGPQQPMVYDVFGEILAPGDPRRDFYSGSIGSGSSNWFGIGGTPTEFASFSSPSTPPVSTYEQGMGVDGGPPQP